MGSESGNYSFVASLVTQCLKQLDKDNEKISILDMGCGEGSLLALLRQESPKWALYGIDIYLDQARYRQGDSTLDDIRQRNKSINFYNIQPYDKLDFLDKSFDIIICNQVFEHVDDLPRLLDILANRLKDSGYLIAGYPTSEIIIEPHLWIPFAHKLKKRKAKELALNIKFTTMKLLNIMRSPRKWSERNEYILNELNYMQTNLFYRSKRAYEDQLKKIGLTSDVSHMYIDSSRSASKIFNQVKTAISLLPSKKAKSYIARHIFGVYTITKKYSL